jgi:hypothetical protein
VVQTTSTNAADQDCRQRAGCQHELTSLVGVHVCVCGMLLCAMVLKRDNEDDNEECSSDLCARSRMAQPASPR